MLPKTPPKPLPLPRWENPSQKSMINHSRRLQEVLNRSHDEMQKQIFEGDHQLDLNLRVPNALQLVKWSMLRKRFEDYTLQFWVTTHNSLLCPRLLVTERRNELPNAMCENLRTWHRDNWDDLPPLAIDLITKTPQNVHNDLYGILYYDGTNWELCKQVKRKELLPSKSHTKMTPTSGPLQNEQPQYKYNLLLPKFKVPVRWYIVSFDIKYDFLLLDKRFKIPYVHLYSMYEKSAQCRNPCRYSELSSLPKRFFFQKQFGFYADPHHSGIVFLGPFQYTESCDVRMMVYSEKSPGSFFEIKHNKPMHRQAWWYATDNTEETVTLKNLAPPQASFNCRASQVETEVDANLARLQPSCNSIASHDKIEVDKNLDHPQPSFNSMASNVEIEVNKNLAHPQTSFNIASTVEESTSMPIITSVVSLRDTPNSDWVGPSITQTDDVVSLTNVVTKYRTILPNSVIPSFPQVVGFTKLVDFLSSTSPAVVAANDGPKITLKKNPVTKGVLAVRLEPSLPHVGYFQANIYGCQRYQITLPDNDSKVLKDLKAANVFLNEFIKKQAEFYPPDLSLTWQPVMSTVPTSSSPFDKYILERKHVITQEDVMTKEQFKLQMALSPLTIRDKAVPRELSRHNSTLPNELRGPVYRLIKMVGTRKDFWSNVMIEIDGVYQTSEMLSQQKEQSTAAKTHFIAKFNELVKTARYIDKRTCDEAVANVRYILKHAPASDSADANTPLVENMANSAENEDMSLLVDVKDNDSIAEKDEEFEVESMNGNHSTFEDSSDEDNNVIETSNDESDDQDDENDSSEAEKLVHQSSQSWSSKNRVIEENSIALVENTTVSVMEEVRRRRLRIPKGTDIALCDSNANSTRMEPDVLTIQEMSNMTMIPIRENSSLENTASSSGIIWTKLKPLSNESTQKAVSVQQECQNIELLDLTGEEVKVSSIKKNVQIETIELEDDDIPLMEASELKIVETLEKGATVGLDNSKGDSANNVEISRISTKSNDQTGSLEVSTASLDIDLVRNTNQTTSEPVRYTTLTRQKIVPVASGKTVSLRKLGNARPFQYKQFCDLSSLKSGTEFSTSNLHVQKMAPFPPYQFVQVPNKPAPLLAKVTPTSPSLLAAGKKTSLSASNMNIHQGPVKLQSVLQPSLLTPVSSAGSALSSKRHIVPKVHANAAHNVTLVSSQPGVPNKTVSLMMKDGKMQVVQVPQVNSSSMKMMLSKDSNIKFIPVMKSVLQSTSGLNTSRTIVVAPAESGNEQTVTSQKIEQGNFQTGLPKANESVTLKPTSRKSFMSQVCRPTNVALSSEPPAKKLCFRSMNNIGPSETQSNSTIIVDPILVASLSKNVSATSIVDPQKEVPKSSSSTIQTFQLVTGAKPTPVLQSTTVRTLPIQQSIKINGKKGYFIKNHFHLPTIRPLKVSNLNLLGSTLASTSSSHQTSPVKSIVHSDSPQQFLNIPQQNAGNAPLKKTATISRMFPSSDMGHSSTNKEHDED